MHTNPSPTNYEPPPGSASVLSHSPTPGPSNYASVDPSVLSHPIVYPPSSSVKHGSISGIAPRPDSSQQFYHSDYVTSIPPDDSPLDAAAYYNSRSQPHPPYPTIRRQPDYEADHNYSGPSMSSAPIDTTAGGSRAVSSLPQDPRRAVSPPQGVQRISRRPERQHPYPPTARRSTVASVLKHEDRPISPRFPVGPVQSNDGFVAPVDLASPEPDHSSPTASGSTKKTKSKKASKAEQSALEKTFICKLCTSIVYGPVRT